MWSQPAPADDKIVVSEIGEQWSPNTDPEKIAARIIDKKCMWSVCIRIGTIIGIKIPKVPHEVPVEKLKNEASINTSAGSKAPGSPVVSIKVFTKTGVLSKSRHTPPIVHASISIQPEVIICCMPFVKLSMNSLNVMIFLGIYIKSAVIIPAKLPQTRA